MHTAASVDYELRWSAMGTACRAWLVGAGAERGARGARSTVTQLETRWSRFLPESDVSRLNAADGAPITVAPETLVIISDAIAWWRATNGLFDPTVLNALLAAGYVQDHASGAGPITDGSPSPGCTGIVLDDVAGTIQLPRGVSIDLGGIGKGRAVDIAVESLQHLDGGLIDLGGDLRVWGASPTGEGWPIAIEDLRDGTTVAVVGLMEGAVTTSSSLRRAWRSGTRSAHHLIDPRTGRPTEGELVTVSVVGARAAAAEVLAKAALVAGSVPSARRLLEDHHVAGLLVPAIGPPTPVGGFEDLCWTRPDEAA